MPIAYQSAVLFVEDMPASRAFYEDLLGQEVALDLGLNVGYKAGFALWQRAHAESIIFAAAGGAPDPSTSGCEAFELYFEADDMPAVWDKLAASGIEAVHGIIEQPWGQRVFRVYDPDRHIIEVGEPMNVVIVRLLREGLSVEEASARSAMPIEIVREIATAQDTAATQAN